MVSREVRNFKLMTGEELANLANCERFTNSPIFTDTVHGKCVWHMH